MAGLSRAAQLLRLLTRLERLAERGSNASDRLTKWRLAIFVSGLLCAVTLFKSGWYTSGNLTVAGFVIVFLIVAAYHNRLEQRIHRLRLWRQIKTVHLARLQLDWSKIPQKPSEPLSSHLYANDLDVIGPHSLLHLLDNTVSDHGRARLTSWLLSQPPPPPVWDARHHLVKELTGRSLFRDRLVLQAHLADEQEINGRRLAAALDHPMEFPRLNVVLAVQSLLALSTLMLGIGTLLNWLQGYWMFSFAAYALIYLLTDQGEELLEHAVGLHHEM